MKRIKLGKRGIVVLSIITLALVVITGLIVLNLPKNEQTQQQGTATWYDSPPEGVFTNRFINPKGEVIRFHSETHKVGDNYYVSAYSDITADNLFKVSVSGEVISYFNTDICASGKKAFTAEFVIYTCDDQQDFTTKIYKYSDKSDQSEVLATYKTPAWNTHGRGYFITVSDENLFLIDKDGLWKINLSSGNKELLGDVKDIYVDNSGSSQLFYTNDKLWYFQYGFTGYYDFATAKFVRIGNDYTSLFAKIAEYEVGDAYVHENLFVEEGKLMLVWEKAIQPEVGGYSKPMEYILYKSIFEGDKWMTKSTKHKYTESSTKEDMLFGTKIPYVYEDPQEESTYVLSYIGKETEISATKMSLYNKDPEEESYFKREDLSESCELFAYIRATTNLHPKYGTYGLSYRMGSVPVKVGDCEEGSAKVEQLESALNKMLVFKVPDTLDDGGARLVNYAEGFREEIPVITVTEKEGSFMVDLSSSNYHSVGDMDIGYFKHQIMLTTYLYLDEGKVIFTLDGDEESFQQFGCNCGG